MEFSEVVAAPIFHYDVDNTSFGIDIEFNRTVPVRKRRSKTILKLIGIVINLDLKFAAFKKLCI